MTGFLKSAVSQAPRGFPLAQGCLNGLPGFPGRSLSDGLARRLARLAGFTWFTRISRFSWFSRLTRFFRLAGFVLAVFTLGFIFLLFLLFLRVRIYAERDRQRQVEI